MIAFIDDHRRADGVEPICRVLPIAPSTYHAHASRRDDPAKLARCTVARLMRGAGLHGVIRGKPMRTTVADKAAPCPLDHVNRVFRAPAPNMLWLSDFT